MVPVTQYENNLQDLVQIIPPIPAEVITPPPFTGPFPLFEPKQFLTPPPSTPSSDFYQLYFLDNNGIEEPVASVSQLMQQIHLPQQNNYNQIEPSNKITKMFPVS